MPEAPYDPPATEARRWAMFCHLGGLAWVIPFPLTNIIVPVVIWISKREIDRYVDDQGKEAINFQITMTIYWLVAAVGVYLLKQVLIGYLFFWLPLLIMIAQLGGSVVGAIRAHDGEKFRYPFILRFL